MLVLSRKYKQSIFIGKEIKITVLSVGPGAIVKLGIQAPKEVKIIREELQPWTNAPALRGRFFWGKY